MSGKGGIAALRRVQEASERRRSEAETEDDYLQDGFLAEPAASPDRHVRPSKPEPASKAAGDRGRPASYLCVVRSKMVTPGTGQRPCEENPADGRNAQRAVIAGRLGERVKSSEMPGVGAGAGVLIRAIEPISRERARIDRRAHQVGARGGEGEGRQAWQSQYRGRASRGRRRRQGGSRSRGGQRPADHC